MKCISHIHCKTVDWNRILFHDVTPHFALEIIFRTVFMFLVVLFILRLSGKRGVRQLSVFELAIILTLGSAAGDATFYDDVAILATVVVCLTAIGLYRLITWMTTKNERFESLLEGRPMYIIENGVMTIKDDSKDSLSKYEFFAELREKGVEHLGQVRVAILETDGNLSVFLFPNEAIKPGLPILPKEYNQNSATVEKGGLYACIYCGTVCQLPPGRHICRRCRHHEWVAATHAKRVT